MFYNRRQFLISTGGLVGISIAAISHKIFSQSQTYSNQNVDPINLQPSPIKQPVSIAPDG